LELFTEIVDYYLVIEVGIHLFDHLGDLFVKPPIPLVDALVLDSERHSLGEALEAIEDLVAATVRADHAHRDKQAVLQAQDVDHILEVGDKGFWLGFLRYKVEANIDILLFLKALIYGFRQILTFLTASCDILAQLNKFLNFII
jgi:hypothetical protein